MATAYDIVMDERKKLVEKIIENMENGDIIFKEAGMYLCFVHKILFLKLCI